MVRRLFLTLILVVAPSAFGQEPKPPGLTPGERKLAARADELGGDAVQLHQRGQAAEAVVKAREALAIYRSLYPASKYPDCHSDVAAGLNNLGTMLEATGQFENALSHHEQGLAIYRRLYPEAKFPDGHPDLAVNLNRVGLVLWRMGQSPRALSYLEQSLAMRRKLYPASKHPDGHADLVRSLNNVGVVLVQMGQAERALPYYEQSMAMRRTLFPVSKHPDGHPYLATGLKNMGFVLAAMGQAKKALPFYEQCLEMRRKLYPPTAYARGHVELVESLFDMGKVHEEMGQADRALPYYEHAAAMLHTLFPPSTYPDGHPFLIDNLAAMSRVLTKLGQMEKALPLCEQCLAMAQKLYPASTYPDGHFSIAFALEGMGHILKEKGQSERALPYYEQSLAMVRRLYPAAKFPNGHPDLAESFGRMGSVLAAMGRAEKALPHNAQSLEMWRKLYPASQYPDGHPNLAGGLNDLGYLYGLTGQAEKALQCYEQSLAMRRKLYPASQYPDGHPALAISLNNLGQILQEMGRGEQALRYYEQSLRMNRTLYPASQYPDGHPDLALSFNNLAVLLQAMGQAEKALPYYEQSLGMRRALHPTSQYPDGHTDLALALNNLGFGLLALGQTANTLPYYEQGLAMRRKLYPKSKYPDGHPDLAYSLENLGFVLWATGSYEKALPNYEQALAMKQTLDRRMLATASEAEALAFANAQALTRDAFLSLVLHWPARSASAYHAVWHSKAATTRVLEQRHAAARVAGTEFAPKLNDLKGVRRRIDQLVQDRRLPPAERDELLARLTDDRDALERELATAIPLLRRADELAGLGPDALALLLPDHSVLIDFVRYTRFDFDTAKLKNGGETRTPSYAAFVLAKGQPIRRIEVGDAKPIDQAVAQWRAAIDKRSESPAAKDLNRLVWAKLAPHLPAGTTTVYLSPDGDLARLPWAALPISDNRVLLEEYAITTVPHGPFVLESLKYRHEYPGAGTTLLLGGVAHNSPVWPDLPGTAKELAALAPLAPNAATTLTRGDASPQRLTELLPKARYAHLATHGYFDAEALIAEQQRANNAMESRQFGDATRRVAAKNPLAFTGLVLANGEVFTGLSLVDLPLENLKLVTLSACETGLGEYTGGEGVQGLQRALHLAGCPNVIASLWKVNDAATAALMAKFYHEMWVNKREPLAALREAQLTIYHHPELIPDLAGERGAPKQKAAVAAVPAKPQAAKRADTKVWAAFVLSGVGK